MELDRFVAQVRAQLAAAAAMGDEATRAVTDRLAGALESGIRLVLLEALTAAAEEITRDLAPRTVSVRLNGRDPEFEVSSPDTEAVPGRGDGADGAGRIDAVTVGDLVDAAIARINLRLPEPLKSRVEEAAERDGMSVNAWLVRVTAAAVERSAGHRRERGPGSSSQRYTGWVR